MEFMKHRMTSQTRVLTRGILLGAIISATIVLTASADLTNCTPAPSGLVSWWRAEGNTGDSGGSNQGGLLNGASFAPGMAGQAFSFDGDNQCVQIPYSPSLAVSNYSVEAWVKPLAQVSDFINQDLIFGQIYGRCQMVVRTGTSGVRAVFQFGIDHFTFFEAASTSEIPIGQFSHLVGTWDGTNLCLYINGVLNAQSTPGVSPADSGCPFYIGGFYSPAADTCNYVGQFFNGLIDEVSCFNRALSGAEIQSIYSAGSAGKCVPTVCVPAPDNLVSWWRGEGNALDQVGGNNGGLLNGAGFDAGVVGQAFRFNGSSNSYIEVADSPTLRLTNALTIECWAKRLNTAEVHVLVEKGGDWTGGHTDFQIVLNDTYSGNPHFGFSSAGGWRGCAVTPDTAWHHYAAVAVSGQVNPILYIDGVPQTITDGGGAATVNLSASTRPLHIGAQVDSQTGWLYYSSTMIDEPAIYSRALSGAEIQAIYTAGSSGKCSSGVAPSIITQPASQTVLAGATATFTATAVGTTPLDYQWRLNGTNIAGATGTSLTLSNVQPAQAGYYALRVTNALGSILSSNALLTVILPCVPAPDNLVSWWRGESNALDQVGGNNGVLLSGAGFGAGVVGQAFRFNGSSNSYVEVADSATLRFTNALTVECWAKRLSTSEVHILAEKGGDWTGGQTDFELALNDTYSGRHFGFSSAGGWRGCAVTPDTAWHHYAAVAVSGQANPILYIDGVPQTITRRGGAATIRLSASTRPLHIGAQVDSQTGWFYYSSTMIDELSIFNRALSAAEIQAIYTAGASGKCLSVAPSIITQPASQAVLAGATATFTAAAAGTPRLDYQWRFKGTNIAGATSTSLTLSNVQPIQAGSYSVLVTNALGSITSSVATLTVLQPPVITRQPRSLVAVPGGAASFVVSVQGRTPLTYQWQRDGSPLVGQTKAALTVTNVQAQDFGAYRVGITNADGSALSDAAMLTLAASPVIRSPGFNSETFMLTVPTEVGLTYVVEYKDSLEDAAWKVLTTLAGTGLPIPITDNGLTNATRFYRVRVR